ncbi:zinc finger protein 69 homolog [Anopheles moucheti]|uniref:zinc finger protein 69 homolog n=1 Tax=Anopheles moucheti TaxID=186751 RepID=UPI0022F04090|nr:zinc finger protein 69 homolog [Anopheles moucheti]
METITRYTAKRVSKTSSDNDRKEIISSYESGLNASVISHILDMNTTAVYGSIKSHNKARQTEGKRRSLEKEHRESAVVQDMWQICQFCLNQDEETLAPITNILDSYLTLENVERTTGVSIQLKGRFVYAVCPDCTKILQESVLFRLSCIRNDAYLQEHFPLVKPATASSDGQDFIKVDHNYTTFENIESLTSELDSQIDGRAILKTTNAIEQVVVKEASSPASFSKEMKDSFNFVDITVRDSDSLPTLHHPIMPELANVEEEFYSANYIEPGEATCSSIDEHETDEIDNTSNSSNLGTVRRKLKKQKVGVYRNGINLFNIPREEQKMLCNICGKFIKNLPIHMVTHTQEANYACPHCPTRMTHLANLTRHIKAVHLKVITKSCELCGKGLTSKSSLLSHMRSQHGVGKLYECKICSKTYGHPSGLRDHCKRAHGSQHHMCATCGRCFTTRPSLKIHQAVHSSDKPFACRECPKSFKSRSANKTHFMAAHSGTLFRCTICGNSYRYKSLLNMHLRKMHTSSDDDKE